MPPLSGPWLTCLAVLALLPGPAPGAAMPAGWEGSLIARSDSLFTHGSRAGAEAVLDSALVLARRHGDAPALRRLLLKQGGRRTWFGDPRGGEAPLREALRLADAARDTVLAGSAAAFLAAGLNETGRSAEAETLLLARAPAVEALGAPALEAWVWNGLGYTALQRGRPRLAADRYARARELARAGSDPTAEGMALVGRGRALIQAGDLQGARREWSEAVTLAARSGSRAAEADALNNLGTMELTDGDPARAVVAFRRALALHAASGNGAAAVTPAVNLALARAAAGDAAGATGSLDSLIARCERERLDALRFGLLSDRASLLMRNGWIGAAKSDLRAAMDPRAPASVRLEAAALLGRALGDEDSAAAGLAVLDRALADDPGEAGEMRLHCEMARAHLRLQLGDARPALEEARAGALAAHRSGLGSIENLGLGIAGRAALALGRPDEARRDFEAGLVLWERQRRLPQDLAWRETVAGARTLHTGLALALLDDTRGGDRAARVRAAWDALQRFKSRTLLERWYRRVGVPSDSIPIEDLDDLQRDVLREGEILLDAFVSEDTCLVFVVSRDSARVVGLPGWGTLEEEVNLCRGLLTGDERSPGSVRDAVRAAAAILPPSLVAELGSARRVTFAADGPLHGFPLEIVPVAGGAADAWLGVRTEVARIPSASVLATLRRSERARAGGDGPLVAVAGLGPGSEGVLPGARAEVGDLAGRFAGVRIFRGRRPSWEQMEGAGGLHFASHAEPGLERPWRTGMRLAPATTDDDGYLRADEVLDHSFDARLVVLSGCASGAGAAPGAEGVLGLATAFLVAGSPAVVATSWPVSDRGARVFADRLYEALAAGEPVASALRTARSATARADDGRYALDAGAWVLVGDGGATLPLHARAWWESAAAWVAGAFLLALALASLSRRRDGASRVAQGSGGAA